MTVSSRTPEGSPGRCVLCDKEVEIEFSNPGDDATCPYCGYLITRSAEILDQFKSFVERTQGDSLGTICSSSRLRDMGQDSLEAIELVMLLEEEFEISVSEDDAASIQTVGDAIRFIYEERGKSE